MVFVVMFRVGHSFSMRDRNLNERTLPLSFRRPNLSLSRVDMLES